ncbi:zinc finger MYM-type protein 5-like, partial [Sitodiplosis mosellana]|uniref:zinc finger MYM-type protein 5-like n=1 Tax=Sitodiplosis mosellana TaxID=263140 RepID=UPI0024441576
MDNEGEPKKKQARISDLFGKIKLQNRFSSDTNQSQQLNTQSSTASSSTNIGNVPQTAPVVSPTSELNCAESDNSNIDSETTSQNAPTDLIPIGADWKKQVFSQKDFPKNEERRSFKPRWIESHEWIEYSHSADAIFCFPCRQFGKTTTKDDVFTKVGYKGWKLALQKGKGLDRHNQSLQHIQNMNSWKEREARRKNATEISVQLSSDIIEKRKYYVKSLIGVVKFLAANELPFRGDWEGSTHTEKGVFTNLLEYTLQIYTSPDVQNELISIMAALVRQQIVTEVNSCDGFTLLVDGTKDRNKNEIISIAARYVLGSTPKESLLSFEKSESLCAYPMAEFILAKLTDFEMDLVKLLSQCYDGAN